MTHVDVAMLARTICPRGGRGGLAVLAAYFDKSSDPVGITSVAGYVAAVDEWQRVEDSWLNAIHCWKKLEGFRRLGRFHMKDLRYAIGIDNAALCIKYFSNIITTSHLYAIGAALRNEHWDYNDWGEDTTVRLGSKYEQCLNMAFDVLKSVMADHFPSERVSIICCLDAPEANIIGLFNTRKTSDCPNFLTITCGTSRELIPLQCCDLGAGVLRENWRILWRSKKWREPWGSLPTGKDGMRTAFWSLAQGEIMGRSRRVIEERRGKNG
jgi:hypothetical protein